MAIGIDISHHKPVTDYHALANSGLDFIYSKASEGTYFADWTWPLNFKGLRKEGFQRIAPFHFLSSEDPQAQLNFFVNVGLQQTPIDGTFPIFIDWEKYASAVLAAQFARLLYNLTGAWPFLYTSEEVIKVLGGTGALPSDLLNCYLVYADYSQNGVYPVPQWPVYTMRQFNNGNFGNGPYLAPGIATGVDHDELNPALDMTTVWTAALAKPPVPVVPTPPVMVSVPYHGEWDKDAATKRNDCGSTCVEMLREWANLPTMTVDSLSAQTTLATSDIGLWPSQLVTLGNANGLTLSLHESTTVADIQAEINAGRPVIALINYRYILGRQDQGYFGNHFVVVTGYNSQYVYTNDPDFWGTNEAQGHNFAVPIQQFSDALRYNNVGQECVFVTGHAAPPPPPTQTDTTMYVNTPPLANGTVQHLIVHSAVPQGANRYIVTDPLQPDSPNGELRDQTVVKVLLPPTQGSDKNGNPVQYVQISPNSEPAAGLWLEYDLLSLAPRSATPAPQSSAVVCRPGVHLADPENVGGTFKNDFIAMCTRLKNAGKPLGAVVVVNDPDCANRLASLVNAVAYRNYPKGRSWDGSKMHDEASAIAYADWLYGLYASDYAQLDKRVYLEIYNEMDSDWATPFNLRFMQRATADGRLVAAFGDSTQTPTVEAFKVREPALRYAMAHGHVYMRHNYGPYVNGKVSGLPVSTQANFDMIGGYHRTLYAAVPADCRPNIIIGEANASDSLFVGAPALIADMNAYNAKLQGDNVLGFCWFTAGISYQSHKYEINAALPDIEKLCMNV